MSRRTKIVFSLLLTAGISMFVIAGLIGRDGTADISAQANR